MVVYWISQKGKALCAAVEAGLIQKNEKGGIDEDQLMRFEVFWEEVEKIRQRPTDDDMEWIIPVAIAGASLIIAIVALVIRLAR